MARKDDAKKPAGQQPETLGKDQPAEHAEPAAAPLVAGDDRGAAGAEAGKQPGGAPPAADGDAGPELSQAAGDGSALGAAPHDAGGPGPAYHVSENTIPGGDGIGWSGSSSDRGLVDTDIPYGPEDVGIADDKGSQNVDGDDAAAVQDGAGDAAASSAVSGAQQAGVGDADGNRDGGDDGEGTNGNVVSDAGIPHEPEYLIRADPKFGDVHIAAASVSAYMIAAAILLDDDAVPAYMSDFLPPPAIRQAAALVRRIGNRATADVLGNHLHLTGHRQTPALDAIEALALKTFASVLVDLDAHVKARADREAAEAKRAAEAEARARHRTPIEETMLEPVPGMLDTVRL